MALQLRSPLLDQTILSSCLLLLLLLVSPDPATAAGKAGGELTVVWGRNVAEGSLREACDTGLYATVLISFLRISGRGEYLTDLSGHDVSAVGADVKHCQRANNVTVLLSVVNSSHNSTAAARDVADHLWNAFLGGRGGGVRRPFGDAALDGVDFYLDGGGAEQERFSDLVRRRLQAIRSSSGGRGTGKAVRLLITATPPCSRVIDADMGGDKLGVFERLHVRFYGEARCGYDYHETRPFWGAWHMWVSTFPGARLLVGLPAATDGMRGWIDPATLRDSVLPSVRDDPNYGGVMLWDRYHDKITGYSRAIEP
jgi:chitinase